MQLRDLIQILTFVAFLSSCGGEEPSDLLVSPSEPDPLTVEDFAGDVFVTTQLTSPSTGPGIIVNFSADGEFKRVMRDLYSSGQYATGLGFLDETTVVVSIEGIDRVDAFDVITGEITPFIAHAGLSSTPLRQLAVSTSDQSIYILEGNTNTIEKFTAQGQRIGAPFIATTVGSCSLTNPSSVVYIPTSQNIAVISSAASGRLSIYDRDGNCITHVTSAPLNAGTPAGIAYHAQTNKLLVTFDAGDSIYAFDVDGTNPVLVFQNTAYIDGPRAIAVDDSGYIYVGSNNTDTIEKLSFNGTVASRALSGPFAGPSVYTQNPTAILVVPR